MIYPIYAYGSPVLKRVAKPIPSDYPNLSSIIENMWETMYNASGVGLAAPQIGKSIRLFIIDTTQVFEEEEKEKGLKQVFINAQKLEEKGEVWKYEEGCLSIPKIRGDVDRPKILTLRYMDSDFQLHEKEFYGLNARVIQHEYDHLEGKLFTEYLKPIKRRLIKRKLESIRKGKINADYKMKFFP